KPVPLRWRERIRTVDPARSRPSPALSYSLGPKHPILCQRVFSLSISYPDLGFVLDHGTKVQFIGFRCAGFEAARALEFYGFCKEGTALDFIQDGRIEHDGELRSIPLTAALALDASTASGTSSKAPYRRR